MDKTTWSSINDRFLKFPRAMASRVDCSEFDSAMGEFRGHFDDDYREFVLRYGGGLVGPLPIYGLRKAPSMGTISGNGTASEITTWFRRMRWPGVEDWLVFCVDQGGNPIGFARDRTVWLSDQTNFPQVVQLGSGFEDFLLKWCLMTRKVQ